MQLAIKGRDPVEVEPGITVRELLKKVDGKGQYFAVCVDGQVADADLPIDQPRSVELLDFGSEMGKEVYWHSTSHVLASAVKRLFPDCKLGIGPAISEGFYYDFDRATPFSEEELKTIEGVMKDIIDSDLPFEREALPRKDALKLFEKQGESYKAQLISEIQDDEVSIYRTQDFVDLCRGPHVPSTGRVGVVKLLSVAGAYWRGLETNPMLQRIYGISFPEERELKDYLTKLEEAERRDHRKLGVALELFSTEESAGPGLVFWHPKGAVIRNAIEEFWKREHVKRGYQLLYTPHIARADLWERSGHLEFYKENMYIFEIDEQLYVLKPMNCPGHILIYKSRRRSYRELPVRYAELGTVYRRERSGVLHGMCRVRGFTQDDAHIFCSREQAPEEIDAVLDLSLYMLKAFGFEDFSIELSVRDPSCCDKYAGDDAMWCDAEDALRGALERRGLPFKRAEGEAVFYGPKLDIKLLDALGRGWQGTTIPFDFNLARRFEVTYVGADGKPHPVFMIHRTVLGALERFVGNLIEHYAGEFPVWLAPVQVRVLTITSENLPWAQEVLRTMEEAGIRAEGDFRDETIGSKIRDAELQKVPYVLVVGKREAEGRKVSVRSKKRGQLGTAAPEDFKQNLLEEIEGKL
ncbi:MAG: threonine--tRNA ligase [Candidatus Eiseniibacteriota bacterium]|nr:MAG: threonine--tRNA ligase [Candidatus Eisenbacteria bacterium]